MMKIVFFGTPDFVIPVAQSLLDLKDSQLVAVVTNPDRPVGRHAYRQAGKQILTPSPIKSWAQQNNLKVIDSTLMIHIIRVIKKLKPDLGILAAYGKIIPQEVIDLFPKGILVIHPSLLPKYRGASPIQAAIFNGDQETGVSIIQMDEKMDHGPILAQFKEKIRSDDTNETLTKRLFFKTTKILPIVLDHAELDSASTTRKKRIPEMNSGQALKKFQDDVEVELFSPPQAQNHSLATYTKLLTKDDGKIDWEWPPEKIERFIRAIVPWPSAWTMVNCHSLSNRESNVIASEARQSRHPELVSGSVLDPRFPACRQAWRGDDNKLRLKILKAHLEKEKLILDTVQLEGKKPVSWKEFQKAYPDFSLVKTCPGRDIKRRG